jgi:hypothetical protein
VAGGGGEADGLSAGRSTAGARAGAHAQSEQGRAAVGEVEGVARSRVGRRPELGRAAAAGAGEGAAGVWEGAARAGKSGSR